MNDRRRASGREVGRGVVVLAVLLLGGVAASRLPISFEPDVAFPSLAVSLSLPDATDPVEVTRRWVVPIESAIRSLGQVRGISGQVSAAQFWTDVRFDSGTDANRKTSRLLSELAGLRAELPERASLDVWPATSGNGGQTAIVVLTGKEAESQCVPISDRIRSVSGVKDVQIYGGAPEEILVRLNHASGPDDPMIDRVRETILRSATTPRLGNYDLLGRRTAVLSRVARLETITPAALRSIPIRTGGEALPLGSLASIEIRRAEPESLSHLQGKRAVALIVQKETDVSPFVVDRGLRRLQSDVHQELPGSFDFTILESEAEPLGRLLRRLLTGFLLAIAALTFAGARIAGLPGALRLAGAPLLALAAALNVYWFAGIPLDLTTLTALSIAVAASFPLALLRLAAGVRAGAGSAATLASAGGILPVAVALAGGTLAPLLSLPGRAFALALAASALALLVPPPPRSTRASSLRAGKKFRGFMRDPATILLFSGTTIYALLTLFGGSLDPRSGSLSADRGGLRIRATLPEGATLEQTEKYISEFESKLADLEELTRYWSQIRPGRGDIFLELRQRSRNSEGIAAIRHRLRMRLRSGTGSVQIVESGGRSSSSGSGLDFSDDIEDHAEADEDGGLYRVVLRSGDAEELRTGYERLRDRAIQFGLANNRISPDWESPPIKVVLSPRATTSPELARRAAALLRSKSSPRWPIPLAGRPRRTLSVEGRFEPVGAGSVPQRADLLDAPLRAGNEILVPAAIFQMNEEGGLPTIHRQSGRFVLPVRFGIYDRTEELTRDQRQRLDQSLSLTQLPPGCDLERPSLRRSSWPRERVRIVFVAALVPLLLFVFASFRLSSLVTGLAALLPAAAGLAAATPLLALGGSRVDELTLFALAAALSATLPVGTELLAAASRRAAWTTPPRAVYRTARESLAPLLGGALAMALMFLGATAGTDTVRDIWAGPLRAAGLAGGAAILAAALVLPAAILAALEWKRRDPVKIREIRRPAEWIHSTTEASLSVRSLTKRYRSGFRALEDVSFELGPGIVGLLGPNGAGKTTLLRLLTGLLLPTRGQILFRGSPVLPQNLAIFRHSLGFLPQEFGAYPGFTAEEFLHYWALERGMTDRRGRHEEIQKLIVAVGLEQDAKRKVRDYSGGMRQRIGIARALLGAPSLLIVDEPTTGLDIESRNKFREILLAAAHERVVILSTHIAGDVEATASRILLLHRGRLRFDGSPAEMVRAARGRVFESVVADSEIRDFGRHFRVTTRVRILAGIRVRAVAPPGERLYGREVEPTLEEAYLAEIDRADKTAVLPRRTSRFSFLTPAATRGSEA